MKISMELLSNAIPATGEGRGSIIDVEVVSDDYGLPYIPAKRIKGILRESAWHLKNANKMGEDILNKIFGIKGGSEGVLILSNGYPSDYSKIKMFLENIATKELRNIFSKETVLNYYTQIVSATAIENGIAREKSLRTIRALRKGLIFEFDIDLPYEYINELKTICQVTRYFGLNRNRGFGHIKMTLDHAKEKKKDYSEDFASGDNLQIDIETLSGILTTNKVGSGQISDDYIPGSTILGLMAGYYIKYYQLGKDAHNDKDFADIFLNNNVQFCNGYLVIDDERSIPSPISITKEKNKDKYFDIASPIDKENIEENNIITKGGTKPFITIKTNGEFIETSVPKITSYHHSRPSNNRNKGRPDKEEGEFFTFEAINSGLHFRSIIRGEHKLLTKLQKAFSSDSFTAYLGKSKNAQYGHCNIKIAKAPKDEMVTINSEEKIVVTLLSDTVLINKYGFNNFDEDSLLAEISRCTGININDLKLENFFIDFVNIGGFNAKWSLPKVQYNALKKGSVFVFTYTGKNPANVSSYNLPPIGIKTREGFGEIGINLHGFNKLKVKNASETDKHAYNDADINKIDTDFLKFAGMQFLISKAKNTAVEILKREKEEIRKLSNSMLGSFVNMVEKSNSIAEVSGKLHEDSSKHGKEEKIEIIQKSIVINFQKDMTDNIKWVSKALNIEMGDEEQFEIFKEYIRFLIYLTKKNRRDGGLNGK